MFTHTTPALAFLIKAHNTLKRLATVGRWLPVLVVVNLGLVKVAIDFAKTLIPYFFKDKEFNPKRALMSLLVVVIVWLSVYLVGVEQTEGVIEMSGELIEVINED